MGPFALGRHVVVIEALVATSHAYERSYWAVSEPQADCSLFEKMISQRLEELSIPDPHRPVQNGYSGAVTRSQAQCQLFLLLYLFYVTLVGMLNIMTYFLLMLAFLTWTSALASLFLPMVSCIFVDSSSFLQISLIPFFICLIFLTPSWYSVVISVICFSMSTASLYFVDWIMSVEVVFFNASA